ncbi:MAG: hypothetical protein D9C04_03990 [Nitrosopumilus sp. B06]|nr:MAG: hypothetical protein EB828_04895 [Nitrosopumilus sp. D6]RNJ79667.1 MAG: hypothetical protein D9C04_03990 [Nitrosopumilus sp. B06]
MRYLGLNRNILVALGASLIVSAAVAHYLGDRDIHVNTTITTATDYLVFFSVFVAAFYLENRKKYRLESGGTDTARLYRDLWRLVASLGVAEVVYIACRWVFQYYLLDAGYDAYAASILSQIISTVIYLVVLNLSVRITRLYRDGD